MEWYTGFQLYLVTCLWLWLFHSAVVSTAQVKSNVRSSQVSKRTPPKANSEASAKSCSIEGEVFASCAPQCELGCDTLNNPPSCSTSGCRQACVCKPGFYRLDSRDTASPCVDKAMCDKVSGKLDSDVCYDGSKPISSCGGNKGCPNGYTCDHELCCRNLIVDNGGSQREGSGGRFNLKNMLKGIIDNFLLPGQNEAANHERGLLGGGGEGGRGGRRSFGRTAEDLAVPGAGGRRRRPSNDYGSYDPRDYGSHSYVPHVVYYDEYEDFPSYYAVHRFRR